MQQDPKISPVGLWSDPSALDAPAGGLIAAEEVVNRRQGTLEPRPGFGRVAASATQRAIDYGSYWITKEASATKWSSGATLYTEDGSTNLSWLDYAIFGVETRKNLYLTTSDRLRKVTTGLASTSVRAGAPQPLPKYSSQASGVAVADGMYVAYRALTLAKDVNGVEVRSGVSGRVVALSVNTFSDMTIRVYLHKGDTYGWVAGTHSIELYRTLNETTETPTDDLYLAKTVELSSTNISNGYVDILDNTKDEELGQALYTNEAQGGLAAEQHITPPAAKCAALFNGSLYLGDLTFPAQQAFTVPSRRTLAASANEIGAHALTGTFTSGSTDVVVADSSLYKVGQIINNSGAADYTVNTEYVRITQIVDATTLRLSGTWNRANGSYNRSVYDSIRIGSQYFLASTITTMMASIRGVDGVGSGEANTIPHSASTLVTAYALSDDTTNLQDDVLATRAFYLEALSAGQTPPQVWATHGDLYNPALPEPTVATGYTLPQEVLPSGVAWSNQLEPEHFTATNMDEAGSGLSRVMALAPLTNSMLIFKSDGLASLHGYEASGISFRDIDKDTRLLYPHAMAVLGGIAYAWCDLGVVACTPDGTTPISSQAIGDRLSPIEKEIGANSTSAHGAWMIANRKDREILLGVPASGALTLANKTYVFNQAQGSWVNWFVGWDLKCALYHEATAIVRVWDASAVWAEVAGRYGADRAYSVTVSAVSGLAVTISAGSGWTPVVGDALTQGAVTALVTAVTDATHFTVSDALSAGAALSYVAFTSTITPIGASARNPAALKCWGECAALWESTEGVARYGVSVTSSVSSSASTQTRTLTTGARPTSEKAEAYRFVVPKAHARSSRIYPSITIRQGLSEWRFAGLVLGYRFMGTRVRTV